MRSGIWLDAIGAARRSLGAEGIQPRGVRKRALEIMKQWKKENKKERKKQQLTEWWAESKDGGLHEQRLCNFCGAVSLWSGEGLKVRCGVAFASQGGIHGAVGEQTVGCFEIAGGAWSYVQKHFQMWVPWEVGRGEQSQPNKTSHCN